MKVNLKIGIVIIILILVGGAFFMNGQIKSTISEKLCDNSKKLFEYNTSLEEIYNGPLFDAHLHLTGQDSEDSPSGIEHSKLFINPDTTDNIFTMLDTNGVTDLIGFLPLNHNFFVAEKKWTNPFLEQTMEINNKYCDRIHLFLFPDSLIGIKSREYFTTKLINDYVKKYPIKGIGEIHVDGESPLYKDIRLKLMLCCIIE